ncbi:accA [Symbiodinium microadriaticum]|nr:accA [Symbiodinium microadriaticum]
MIVDAFVAYSQPLFVYIPPHAELRGGAWVVVDHTINKDVMEFYAAEDARGGVLEAAGAASIKFRDNEILKTANRLDPILIGLQRELAAAKGNDGQCKEIKIRMTVRQKLVLGVFRQIAVHFADLHDTPGRMQAKGVIRQQVTWAQSRHFFYWRLRRRLAEFDVANSMRELDKSIKTRQDAIDVLKEWCFSAGGSDVTWNDDKKAMLWLQEHTALLRNHLMALKEQVAVRELGNQLTELLQCVAENRADGSSLAQLVGQAMAHLPDAERKTLQDAFATIN